LLIQPFSVPPDLASRGLTGQVVATKVLDDLVKMDAQTSSQRAPASYANSWAANDIKVEIPETGMSLAELDGFLRERLGHDTRLSGEVVRVPGGLSITARTPVESTQSISGADADIDGLIQQLAESIFRITQSYRYGIFLSRYGRNPESEALFRGLALNGPLSERPWSYVGWQNAISVRTHEAPRPLQVRSVTLAPDLVLGWENLSHFDDNHSRPEIAIEDEKKVLSLLSGKGANMVRADAVLFVQESMQGAIDRQTGDFQNAQRLISHVLEFQAGRLGGTAPSSGDVAINQSGMHDVTAARLTMDGPVQGGTSPFMVTRQIWQARLIVAEEVEDWPGVVTLASRLPPGDSLALPSIQATMLPHLALAEAKLGRFSAAQIHIGATPADCYDCLIARAQVAELQGQAARADFWFARAATEAPSIPFAYVRWGQALLRRGKTDDAIAQFRTANQKGPRFADPLEGWGEALMAKNQSHLALAEFAEAEKHAPNWGRLHLKWGEALVYAGKRHEAMAHFARAAQIDLTPSEKSELARHP